jgi:hypothetical protein
MVAGGQCLSYSKYVYPDGLKSAYFAVWWCLEPLQALPCRLLQYQQSTNSRDQHVESPTADDDVPGILDHACEQIGRSGRWAVWVSEEKRAVGAVAEDSTVATSHPVVGSWWDVESCADVRLSEPRSLV